ncbi:hypothetical protein BGX27_009303 [Mortierella sp. AM989]|nr:hypothetical protein BGX27_009303 [Mortierella sp. AM989]
MVATRLLENANVFLVALTDGTLLYENHKMPQSVTFQALASYCRIDSGEEFTGVPFTVIVEKDDGVPVYISKTESRKSTVMFENFGDLLLAIAAEMPLETDWESSLKGSW